jgi:hypothetical protein
MEYDVSYKLTNYISDLAFDEVFINKKEKIKFIKLCLKYYETRRNIYEEIISIFSNRSENQDEFYRWQSKMVNVPFKILVIELNRYNTKLYNLLVDLN